MMLSPDFWSDTNFLVIAGHLFSILLPCTFISRRYFPKSFLFSKRMKLLSILLWLRSSLVTKLYFIIFKNCFPSLFVIFRWQALTCFTEELMPRCGSSWMLLTIMTDLFSLSNNDWLLFKLLESMLLIMLWLSDICVSSSIFNQIARFDGDSWYSPKDKSSSSNNNFSSFSDSIVYSRSIIVVDS